MKIVMVFVLGLAIGCYTPPAVRDTVVGGLKTAAVAAVRAAGAGLRWAGSQMDRDGSASAHGAGNG
jgi:hypothetical protein